MKRKAARLYGWREASLAAIRPEGWLKDFLIGQRDGLTGHLEVAGYPFNTEGWRRHRLRKGERTLTGWWPYEQYAYWVDGMIRCGLLLDDPFLVRKARRQIDHVMKQPADDGYLGPSSIKKLVNERGSQRWPHAVFFRAVMADHAARPDPATLEALTRHYLSETAPHENSRNICNIEIMAWVYAHTADERLRDLALSSYQTFQTLEEKSGATLANMTSDTMARDHGPTYMELFKLGAALYRITGDRPMLLASQNAWRKLERDHVLVDGVPSATEHMRGIYSRAGHETCVITDALWSLGVLLAATGEARYGDAMERIAFNALPGAVTPDFRALQYFSGPNQIAAGPRSNHHEHGTGSAHISYRPNPATECCPGNVHRAMPAYIGRMWMEDEHGGIVAALHGPGCYKTTVDGHPLTITATTAYPFDDAITWQFSCPELAYLRFSFRIPGWCRKPAVTLNGKPLKCTLTPGTFATLTRMVRDGDTLTLRLPRTLRQETGPENSAAYSYGPLVMALHVPEDRTVEATDKRSSSDFPAWTMTPTSGWNYGVSAGAASLRASRVETSPVTQNPWDSEHPPVRVWVPARKIPGWRIQRKRRLINRWRDKTEVIEGPIDFTPPLPPEVVRSTASHKQEMIALLPLGATRLRLTWLPVLHVHKHEGDGHMLKGVEG